jgi:hypothetical protein
MIRVVVWATHLQTDILALCAHLDRCADVALLIVTEQAAAFAREPVARALALRAPILARDQPGLMAQVRAFGADVAVADNHVPPAGTAPRLFYMWHGMGWKARSRLDLEVFYQQVRQLTGDDPRRPSDRFRAQCYGPTDLAWRIGSWGIAASNCVVTGMCFSDMLRDPPYVRADITGEFGIDVLRRKTLLLSITWHYGGIFARDGSLARQAAQARDLAFVRRIVETTDRRGANLLICLHDAKRYDAGFLAELGRIASAAPTVAIRFKSEHPDNLADLLVADVMVSNLSSFLACHYVLGRPSVHILPAHAGARRIERVVMLLSRFRIRVRSRTGDVWMLDPADTGGANAADEDTALAAIGAALDDPASGIAPTRAWLQRHLHPIDGQACARAKAAIDQLCATCRDAVRQI